MVFLPAVLLLAGQACFGQEVAIAFDPADAGPLLELTPRNVIVSLVLALVCGVLWKILMWQLESRRETIPWAKVRFWWPTAMLVWGGLIVAICARFQPPEWLLGVLIVPYAALNFPALTAAIPLVQVLNETFRMPAWVPVPAVSVLLWAGNHLMVRLAEWRAWMNVPVTLQLAEVPGAQRRRT